MLARPADKTLTPNTDRGQPRDGEIVGQAATTRRSLTAEAHHGIPPDDWRHAPLLRQTDRC